jgi:hypothetical protein
MAGFAHQLITFTCLAWKFTCEASTLKANAAASFLSVAMGGLATQPINNSASRY